MALLCSKLGDRLGWVVKSTSQPPYHQKQLRYQLTSLVGPKRQSKESCDTENFFLPTVIEIWTVRPVVSRSPGPSQSKHLGKELNSGPLATNYFCNLQLAAATPPNQPQRCILTDYFNNYNFSKLK
jgi:hypothetical protein